MTSDTAPGEIDLSGVRRDIIRAIAAYDREVAHPEIYEDLEDE